MSNIRNCTEFAKERLKSYGADELPHLFKIGSYDSIILNYLTIDGDPVKPFTRAYETGSIKRKQSLRVYDISTNYARKRQSKASLQYFEEQNEKNCIERKAPKYLPCDWELGDTLKGEPAHVYETGLYHWYRAINADEYSDDLRQIDTLYIVEGEFKAWQACKDDIPTLGVSGVSMPVVQTKRIVEILETLPNVKKVVWIHDADAIDNHKKSESFSRASQFFNGLGRLKEAIFKHNSDLKLNYMLLTPPKAIREKAKGLDDLLHVEGQKAVEGLLNASLGANKYCYLYDLSESIEELTTLYAYSTVLDVTEKDFKVREVDCLGFGGYLGNSDTFESPLNTYLDEYEKLLIQAKAGTGKTYYITRYLAKRYDLVILVAPYKSIVKQQEEQFNKDGLRTIGLTSDELEYEDKLALSYGDLPPVIVTTTSSLKFQLDRLRDAIEYNGLSVCLLIDEFHDVCYQSFRSSDNQAVINAVREFSKVICLTATPPKGLKYIGLTHIKVNTEPRQKIKVRAIESKKSALGVALNCILEDQKKGLTTVVRYDDTKQLLRLAETCKSEGLNVCIICNEKDEVKKSDMYKNGIEALEYIIKNEEAPKEYNVILTTSKITDGTNFNNVDHFGQMITIHEKDYFNAYQFAKRIRRDAVINLTVICSEKDNKFISRIKDEDLLRRFLFNNSEEMILAKNINEVTKRLAESKVIASEYGLTLDTILQDDKGIFSKGLNGYITDSHEIKLSVLTGEARTEFLSGLDNRLYFQHLAGCDESITIEFEKVESLHVVKPKETDEEKPIDPTLMVEMETAYVKSLPFKQRAKCGFTSVDSCNWEQYEGNRAVKRLYKEMQKHKITSLDIKPYLKEFEPKTAVYKFLIDNRNLNAGDTTLISVCKGLSGTYSSLKEVCGKVAEHRDVKRMNSKSRLKAFKVSQTDITNVLHALFEIEKGTKYEVTLRLRKNETFDVWEYEEMPLKQVRQEQKKILAEFMPTVETIKKDFINTEYNEAKYNEAEFAKIPF